MNLKFLMKAKDNTEKKAIYTHLCYQNGKRFLFLMPVLTLIMIAYIFILDLSKMGFRNFFPYHLAAALIFIVNFFLHLFFRLKEPSNGKFRHYFINILSIFSIFAVSNSIIFFVKKPIGYITIYLICVFGMGVFIRLALAERIIFYTVFHAIYVTSILLTEDDPSLLTANQTNGALIVILGFVLSTSVYNLFRTNVLQNMEILKNQKKITSDNHKLKDLLNQNQSLMGILAHDIRNPLAQIKICHELLNLLEDENERARIMDLAERSTEACFYIVDEVMALKESMNRNKKLPKTQFPLEDICQNLKEEFKGPIQRKSLLLNLSNCDGTLPLYSNKDAAQIILRNLMSNAVKFSPTGGEITIRTKSESDCIEIEIEDTGPGFTDEDRSHLFTPFKTLSAKPTGDEPSSGLGLSIIKEFCDKLDIRIELFSTPGQGSRFRLQFPKTVMNPESPGQKEA